MSWDADLVDRANDVCVGEWNYTHNCNAMANTVVERFMPGHARTIALQLWGGTGRKCGRLIDGALVWRTVEEDDGWTASWWDILGTFSSKESLAFLDLIIGAMCEAPEMFREMNPENGWGDYDSFLAVLVTMRDRVAKYPHCEWVVSG